MAVDGKTLRGAARATGRTIHPLAVCATSPAWSWPHSTLARRPTRSPASSLLETLAGLAGVIVTSDAMHTQREHADHLLGRGAQCIVIAKEPGWDEPAVERGRS
ncbi:hypothetical protein [Streptomyces mirabilis]